MLEHHSNNGSILHTCRGNGKELAEQIDEAIKLEHHPKDRPTAHDEEYATEECRYAPDAIPAGEESDRAGHADGEGQADEEEEVAEGKEGGIEEEEDAQEEEDAAQEEQSRPYLRVVGHHYCVPSFT